MFRKPHPHENLHTRNLIFEHLPEKTRKFKHSKFSTYTVSTALPNLDQATRSTLVGVKKNKTIKWLSESNQDDLTLLAMKSRQQANILHKKEKEEVAHKRQQLKLQVKKRHDVLEKKVGMEREKLSKVHVITTCC